MDPFWEKVVLMVIDKGLLTLAGGGIAYLAALALERYRRHQAVVLELSKLRAQAFVRLMSLLGEHQVAFDALAGSLARTEENEPMFAVIKARVQQIRTELFTSLPRDMVLMDPTLRAPIRAYFLELYSLDTAKLDKVPLSAAELEARNKKLSDLRDAVMELVPPLPKL